MPYGWAFLCDATKALPPTTDPVAVPECDVKARADGASWAAFTKRSCRRPCSLDMALQLVELYKFDYRNSTNFKERAAV